MTIVDYILLLILNALCIVAAVKDVKTRKIPNWIPVTLFSVWFVSIFVKWGLAANVVIDISVMDVYGNCAMQVICACVVFCILALCIKFVDKRNEKLGRPNTTVFGMGDIKLIMMVCLYLSVFWSLICLFIACIGFIIYILILRTKTNQNITIAPFAPFILLGVMVSTILLIVL